MNSEREPLHTFRFDGPEIHRLAEYSELQRAVMPVVGLAGGTLKAFATS